MSYQNTLYLPIVANKSFTNPRNGILRAIITDPKGLVIEGFQHMIDYDLDFRPIGGFRADLLPKLEVRLLEGASCSLLASTFGKPTKVILQIDLLSKPPEYVPRRDPYGL